MSKGAQPHQGKGIWFVETSTHTVVCQQTVIQHLWVVLQESTNRHVLLIYIKDIKAHGKKRTQILDTTELTVS